MTYKNALTLYEEMIEIGIPKEQASLQAHQLGSLSDEMGGRYNELNAKLDLSLEGLRKDLSWMRVVGGVIMAIFVANLAGIISLIFMVK